MWGCQAARSDSYAFLNRDTVQEAEEGQEWGSLIAAARLGERASIGNGFWVAAHGGAVSCCSVHLFYFTLLYFTLLYFTLLYFISFHFTLFYLLVLGIQKCIFPMQWMLESSYTSPLLFHPPHAPHDLQIWTRNQER